MIKWFEIGEWFDEGNWFVNEKRLQNGKWEMTSKWKTETRKIKDRKTGNSPRNSGNRKQVRLILNSACNLKRKDLLVLRIVEQKQILNSNSKRLMNVCFKILDKYLLWAGFYSLTNFLTELTLTIKNISEIKAKS